MIPIKALDLYKKAKILIKDKKYNKALTFLEKALKKYPEYAEALSLLGYVNYKLKFKNKTKEQVYELSKKALELNSGSAGVWRHMGNANSYLNKYEDAITCYNKANTLGGDDVKLFNNFGSAYMKLGDLDKALEYYNKGLRIEDNFPPLLNNVGSCYIRKGDYDKALFFFEKAIDLDPYFSAPYNNIGNLHNEKGDYEKAQQYYSKAIEIDPDDSHNINNLGTVFYYLKDYKQAIKQFKKAIDLDSDYGDPWTNLGAIYSEKGDYNKAIECYDNALELDSNLYKAWYNRGNAFHELDDFSESIKSFRKCLQINEHYFPAWSNLGSLYLRIKNYTEAQDCYNNVLEINPNSVIDLFNLGNTYRLTGQFNKSIEYYQKVIELDPNNGNAWYNEGISYLMIEDFELAIKCIEESISLLPNHPGTWGNLGMAYLGKSNFNNAIKCFNNVLELNPKDILALNTLGQIYIQLKDIRKAIPVLKKALEIEPSALLHIDTLGYEFYQETGNNIENTQLDDNIIIPYTPDIYASIGMAYHILGNNKEGLKFLNLAIKADSENFIGYANLGIYYLNIYNFLEALSQFDKAINLIKKYGLNQELKKVRYYKDLAESALKLKPELKFIDDKISKLIKVKEIKEIIRIGKEIQISFKELKTNINLNKIPDITKNLLEAKSFIFESLLEILNFKSINSKTLTNIHNLFSSKTDFIKFFFSFQNFRDLYNLISGYNNIEDIPETILKEIFEKISNLKSLASELSEIITGSISETVPEVSKTFLTESKRIRSGVEQINALKVDVASDKEKIFPRDELDIIYIKQVCDEIHQYIPKYKNVNLNKSDYLDFLSQFPDSLRKEGAKLLTRIKYISFEEMVTSILKELNSIAETPENCYLISFRQGWQKSQDTWEYLIRKLSGERFNTIKIENIEDFLSCIQKDKDYLMIFLDDVILTGSQFVDYFDEEIPCTIDFIEASLCNNEKLKFYIVAGLGSFESKRYISQNIKIFDENSIRFGYTIKEREKAFSNENYPDSAVKDELIDFLRSKHPFEWNGYKDSQSLVVLEWNTPDNTIACLRENTCDWKTLFPRS